MGGGVGVGVGVSRWVGEVVGFKCGCGVYVLHLLSSKHYIRARMCLISHRHVGQHVCGYGLHVCSKSTHVFVCYMCVFAACTHIFMRVNVCVCVCAACVCAYLHVCICCLYTHLHACLCVCVCCVCVYVCVSTCIFVSVYACVRVCVACAHNFICVFMCVCVCSCECVHVYVCVIPTGQVTAFVCVCDACRPAVPRSVSPRCRCQTKSFSSTTWLAMSRLRYGRGGSDAGNGWILTFRVG